MKKQARLSIATLGIWVAASGLGCVHSDPAASSEPDSSAPVPLAAASAQNEVRVARVDVPISLERSCREICDRSRELQCTNGAQCVPNCLAMGSVTPCTDPVLALYACLVGQPARNWECAPDGVAAIREGLCDGEQGRAVACMEAKMH